MTTSRFIPCRTCASKEGPFPGYFYVTNAGAAYVAECACHKKWTAKQMLARKYANANVWQDFEYSPLKDYRGDESLEDVHALIAYAKSFELKFRDKMVYMYGTNGTQKTTLAMWVASELLKRDVSVLYTLMETLSVSLTPDFNAEDNSRAEFIQKALDVDLLIVDESYDKRTTTLYKSGYQLPYIANFLKTRFEVDHKAIIFISNVQASDIASNGFGETLQSFVSRNTCSSTLQFSDVFIKKANVIDSKGLFK